MAKDPYELLVVSYGVSYVDLKKAYRKAIMECHPDKFAGENVMQELKDVAAEQFGYYTQAFEAIKLKKGFNKKVNEK
jgi:curved DNA-binding protein CbpA